MSVVMDGSAPLQLPAGVGEVVPDTVFVGPASAVEAMLKDFGVRYVVSLMLPAEEAAFVETAKVRSRCLDTDTRLETLRREMEQLRPQEKGDDEGGVGAASCDADANKDPAAADDASDLPVLPQREQEAQQRQQEAVRDRYAKMPPEDLLQHLYTSIVAAMTAERALVAIQPPMDGLVVPSPSPDGCKPAPAIRRVFPEEVRRVRLPMEDSLSEDLVRVLRMLPADRLDPVPTIRDTDIAAAPRPSIAGPLRFVEFLDAILAQNVPEAALAKMAAAHVAALKKAAEGTAAASEGIAVEGADTAAPAPLDVPHHAVFIHCVAGKSRSPTVGAAYAMLSPIAGHVPLDEVMERLAYVSTVDVQRSATYVARRGAGCRPNPRFIRDLMLIDEAHQNALLAASDLPPDRRRPYQCAFDLEAFHTDGLLELFTHSPDPAVQIPELVVRDVFERCGGDVVRARSALMKEQAKLLFAPGRVREVMADTIQAMLDDDLAHFVAQKRALLIEHDAAQAVAPPTAVATSSDVAAREASQAAIQQLEARIRALHGTIPRATILRTIADCNDDLHKAANAIRKMQLARIPATGPLSKAESADPERVSSQ